MHQLGKVPLISEILEEFGCGLFFQTSIPWVGLILPWPQAFSHGCRWPSKLGTWRNLPCAGNEHKKVFNCQGCIDIMFCLHDDSCTASLSLHARGAGGL